MEGQIEIKITLAYDTTTGDIPDIEKALEQIKHLVKDVKVYENLKGVKIDG